MTKPHTLTEMKRTHDLVPAVTELLQLIAALGLELDGLSATNHPFLHRVLMLHLCDRIAKVNRCVCSNLLASLSQEDGTGEQSHQTLYPIASTQKGV